MASALRATQKVMVAVVALCVAVGAALAIPTYAQSLEKPARPSGLAATSTSSTVTLTWDNPGDCTITGYKILSRAVATESILTVLVSDTGSSSTAYIARGLSPSTTYQFAVMAVNGAGNSTPSQIITVSTAAQTGSTPTTPAPTTPTPPTRPAPPTTTTPTTPTASPDLLAAITNLTGIIEQLLLKIAVLEERILAGSIAQPITDSGNFVPIYYAATSHSNLVQKSYYPDRLFLENFTGRLSQTPALPYDVYLTMDECGEPKAVYYLDYKRITICYELVTLLENRLAPYYNTNEELSRGVGGFVTWVTLHELGHALIDVYDLPVTGNEEDAVDQFATIIALEYIRLIRPVTFFPRLCACGPWAKTASLLKGSLRAPTRWPCRDSTTWRAGCTEATCMHFRTLSTRAILRRRGPVSASLSMSA